MRRLHRTAQYTAAVGIQPAGNVQRQHRAGEGVDARYQLGVLIGNAAEDSFTQPELFFSIQQTLRNYLTLSLTRYKLKINQYII